MAPWLVEAASLGKLTVYSVLGQPLRAEMEIGASQEELLGMNAKLAPNDVFTQTGVDMAPALRDLRFVVEKRANGKSVVKVSSVKPINEPFLDLLVELNWPAGRLVREYTFLLDPPELASKGNAGQTSVAEAKVVETVRAGRPSLKEKAVAVAPAKVASAKSAPEKNESEKGESNGNRVVKAGETLRKIAAENKPEGVSLEQMLVALFRNNQDAFIGKNINRLKAGAILDLPDKAAVETIGAAEAHKVLVAQAADWNAYRQKLASATAKSVGRESTAGQSASGKIAAKLDEKATVLEQSKDQVKVSRTESAGKGGAAGKAAAEVDQIAKDRALKEAQERLASLEKNVGDLQKLLDMKSQKLAQLEQANVKKEESKPVEAPKQVEPAKVEDSPKPAEPSKPVESAPPAEAAKPAEAPATPDAAKAPETAKPAEAPKPPPMPVDDASEAEPGLLDALAENPLLPVGGAGILALLGGYFAIKRRRRQEAPMTTTAAPSVSGLGPNSVFRTTGGQSVDTANTPPQTGDFSQMGPGTIDTDEVDPVAEADVYMAYGRDTQAEEILLEAMQKDPQRTAIPTKLLEIYASRKSVKQFETLASELYAQTGGVGPEWAKVSAMGRSLNPENPLYSGASKAAPAFDADATLVVTPEDVAGLAVPEDKEPDRALSSPAQQATDEPFEIQAFEPLLDAPAPVAQESIPAPATASSAGNDDGAFEFDLGTPLKVAEEFVPADVPEASPVAPAVAEAEEPYIDTVVGHDGNSLDYSVASAEKEAAAPAEMAFDALSLVDEVTDPAAVDLDFTQAEAAPVEPDAVAPAVSNEPVVSEVAAPSELPAPDFSPEGTLVTTGALSDFGMDTFVGPDEDEPVKPAPVAETFPAMPAVDFDLHQEAPKADVAREASEIDAAATLVNPLPAAADDALDFDIKLGDSVFLGEPNRSDFDLGSINLDLTAEPSEPAELPTPKSPAAVPDIAASAASGERSAQWEEVNTKLDLAKAYEEMGDLEGARELLQEVLGEGPVDLVEEARTILDRIGG